MKKSEILIKYKPERQNLLHILHAYQAASGKNYISKQDIKEIAEYLSIPLSSVYGVVTYYSLFSEVPRGKYVIRVCDSPVCNLKESELVIDALKSRLGIEAGETTEDGYFTLELCECLGRCAQAPSVMINDEIYVGVSEKTVESLIERYRRQ